MLGLHVVILREIPSGSSPSHDAPILKHIYFLGRLVCLTDWTFAHVRTCVTGVAYAITIEFHRHWTPRTKNKVAHKGYP